jgi:hypothetical protein
MPFKSKAQRRKFAELLVKGEISEEWNRSTGLKKLPERVRPKKGTRKKKPAGARKKSGGRGSRKKTARKAAGRKR